MQTLRPTSGMPKAIYGDFVIYLHGRRSCFSRSLKATFERTITDYLLCKNHGILKFPISEIVKQRAAKWCNHWRLINGRTASSLLGGNRLCSHHVSSNMAMNNTKHLCFVINAKLSWFVRSFAKVYDVFGGNSIIMYNIFYSLSGV
jgi:hypothetical protein